MFAGTNREEALLVLVVKGLTLKAVPEVIFFSQHSHGKIILAYDSFHNQTSTIINEVSAPM